MSEFRVLIVEDDLVLCATLKKVLELAGYDVQCAHTALEAGDLASKEKFQLALIDWDLGSAMSGIQVGRALRRQGMATFLITGYSKEQVRAEWRDPLEGFVQFIEKPIDKDDLLDKIERIKKSTEATEP